MIINNSYIESCKRNKKTCIILVFLILDLLFLLFFGKTYSKMELISNVYLHDVLNITFMLWALPVLFKKKNRENSIDLLLLVAFIYLLFSFCKIDVFNNKNQFFIAMRQFMLFGYLAINYILVKKIATDKTLFHYLYKFVIILGQLAVVIQTLYVVYLLVISDINPFFSRNYFSPILVMGIFIFASHILFFYKGKMKYLVFFLTLILSFTIGHDSAYLAIIGIFFTWFFLKVDFLKKIFVIVSFLGIIALLFFKAPTFKDANTQIRLYDWEFNMKKILIDNYFVVGEGFGGKYFEEEQRLHYNKIMRDGGHKHEYSKEQEYIRPSHNSFITIMHHTGGISILFLIIPIFLGIKKGLKNNKKGFLITALVGMSVWSFFNVILELPHSSSIYWIIFFIFIFLKDEIEKE